MQNHRDFAINRVKAATFQALRKRNRKFICFPGFDEVFNLCVDHRSPFCRPFQNIGRNIRISGPKSNIQDLGNRRNNNPIDKIDMPIIEEFKGFRADLPSVHI